jgi:hypothetical protein
MSRKTIISLAVLTTLAIILGGPALLGYHHGATAGDYVTGAHCIRWFGQVWCHSAP